MLSEHSLYTDDLPSTTPSPPFIIGPKPTDVYVFVVVAASNAKVAVRVNFEDLIGPLGY